MSEWSITAKAQKIDQFIIFASLSSAIEPSLELPLALSPGDHTASEATPGTIPKCRRRHRSSRECRRGRQIAGPVIMAAGQHHRADAARRSADTTECPVAGFLPPLARKRPANASCRQLMAMAQWWK